MLPSLVWITEYQTGQFYFNIFWKAVSCEWARLEAFRSWDMLLACFLIWKRLKYYSVEWNILLHTGKKCVTWLAGIFIHIFFDQLANDWIARVRHFHRLEEISLIQWHNFCVHRLNSASNKPAKFCQNPHILSGNYLILNFVLFYSGHPLGNCALHPINHFFTFFV